MPVAPDLIAAKTPIDTSYARTRVTLSVRAGTVLRTTVATDTGRTVSAGRTGSRPASCPQNGAVPLKRLTAGRKELKIAHDGATYLLRITKSNKLILTKALAAPVPVTVPISAS